MLKGVLLIRALYVQILIFSLLVLQAERKDKGMRRVLSQASNINALEKARARAWVRTIMVLTALQQGQGLSTRAHLLFLALLLFHLRPLRRAAVVVIRIAISPVAFLCHLLGLLGGLLRRLLRLFGCFLRRLLLSLLRLLPCLPFGLRFIQLLFIIVTLVLVLVRTIDGNHLVAMFLLLLLLFLPRAPLLLHRAHCVTRLRVSAPRLRQKYVLAHLLYVQCGLVSYPLRIGNVACSRGWTTNPVQAAVRIQVKCLHIIEVFITLRIQIRVIELLYLLARLPYRSIGVLLGLSHSRCIPVATF
mmetsp:Transcript_33489/g.88169  ORF Transcript_33489/g.88169 Transcript_33489/m.88169 type:complete len:302 (-) Transcript_33489:97-1002(-)